jgi:hypothetical protein
MDRKELRRNLVEMCELSSLDITNIDNNPTLKGMGMHDYGINDILIHIEDTYGVRPEGITLESTFEALVDAVHVLLL